MNELTPTTPLSRLSIPTAENVTATMEAIPWLQLGADHGIACQTGGDRELPTRTLSDEIETLKRYHGLNI